MLTVELASDFDSLCSSWQLACDCSSLSSVLCLCCCYVQRYEVAVAVASILIPCSPSLRSLLCVCCCYCYFTAGIPSCYVLCKVGS